MTGDDPAPPRDDAIDPGDATDGTDGDEVTDNRGIGDAAGDETTCDPDAAGGDASGRVARATVETAHADPGTVAAALRPDNTAEMDTVVVECDGERGDDGSAGDPTDDATGTGRRVRTTIERGTAAGLRSTVDDYLVNLDVADRTVRHANDHTTANERDTRQ